MKGSYSHCPLKMGTKKSRIIDKWAPKYVNKWTICHIILAIISTKLVEMDIIVEYFISFKAWMTEKTHFCPFGTELLAISKRFLLSLTYKSKIRLHMHLAFVQK